MHFRKGNENHPGPDRVATGRSVMCFALGTRFDESESTIQRLEAQISVRISTERTHFEPGEDVRLHVEIWNEGNHDLFVFKNIDAFVSNELATINLTLYDSSQAIGPGFVIAGDSFSSERASYPPLATELPRYWIALPPQHFYGQEVVMLASWYSKLSVPGKYRIQGKYRSRGFLARSINNPLLHYADELKQLPYEAWVGEKVAG